MRVEAGVVAVKEEEARGVALAAKEDAVLVLHWREHAARDWVRALDHSGALVEENVFAKDADAEAGNDPGVFDQQALNNDSPPS